MVSAGANVSRGSATRRLVSTARPRLIAVTLTSVLSVGLAAATWGSGSRPRHAPATAVSVRQNTNTCRAIPSNLGWGCAGVNKRNGICELAHRYAACILSGMKLRYTDAMHARAAILLGIGLALALVMWGDRQKPEEIAVPPPPNALTPPVVRSWREAARRVEENRGESVGRAAAVVVPSELRHYSDRRRFLAVQVAESRVQDYALPHDYADLVRLIQTGEMVEMKPVGDNYILYGVGSSVSDDPFTHYDRATGADIPLYENYADFQDGDAAMADSIVELKDKAAGLQKDLRALKAPKLRKQRAAYLRQRKTLQAQIKGTQAAVKVLGQRRTRVAAFYDDYDKRRLLVAEYQVLADKAADFDGRSYDIRTPAG